jgi:acylphosphatase
MALERRVIRVFGHVQGVFFRRSVQEEALRLGLSGFARNEPDGSVTIEVEGDPHGIDALIAWSHHGPPAARVDRVIVEQAEPKGDSRFQTR